VRTGFKLFFGIFLYYLQFSITQNTHVDGNVLGALVPGVLLVIRSGVQHAHR
jgi:hypothetical protein